MNLTCSYCQTPFTLGMAEKVAALQKMHAEDLHHYDAHCPRCGRANAVSRERLEMFTPGWEEAIKPTASEPAPVSSIPGPEASQSPMPEKQVPPAPATPVKATAKKPAAKKPAKPAPKKPAKKAVKAKPKPKKAAKKPAAKKKTKRK
jgi:hypothetical protein